MTFDSRTPEYAWADVQLMMLGKLVTKVRGVKFTIAQEKEYLHARGENPHSIQRGNKTPEGELVLLQSEVEAIQTQLQPHEDLTDVADFDVVVAFVQKGTVKVNTYILKGCQFTEDPRELKQNDKFMELTLPIMFLRREAA